ncbi:MAG: sialidase family protein, partial [Thermoplasmata archaeon]
TVSPSVQAKRQHSVDCSQYPDYALHPAPLNLSPGPEYAPWARIYQGMPSIELAVRGALWVTWTGGGATEGPFNYVILVRSEDQGETWSEPLLVIDPPGNVSAKDPVLWRDPVNRIWLFWDQNYGGWYDGRGGLWSINNANPDVREAQWSSPRRLTNGFMTNKPLVLRSSEWLLPTFVPFAPPELEEENEHFGLGLSKCVIDVLTHDLGTLKGENVYGSVDEGQTWELWGQAHLDAPTGDMDGSGDATEAMLVERRDGSLWMLMRTFPGIGESLSLDGGRTWSPIRPSGIRAPLSRFFIRRLRSGRLLLVRNDPPSVEYPEDCKNCGERNRSHLKAFISEDDGRTWVGGLMLDERETVSYPDGTEAPDGTVYVVYDWNRYTDSEILMAKFQEEDVLRGECVTDVCRLRMLVNKAAPGHIPR